ncbi:MAG: OmpH family outer membrane protein [Bilophila sp.]
MFRVMSLALVACLLMAGSAFAETKIGVFNSQAVAMDSDAAKAAQQKLQSQFGAERSQLEKQAKDLQTKGETLQTQVAKMNAKEREEKQMEFLRLRRAFEEKSRNFARKVENTENQIRQNMAQQIYQAAQTIAQKQKLYLILDAASGSVMYATPQLDITKAVLAEVNRLWKASGSKFPEPQVPARNKWVPANSPKSRPGSA